MSPTCATAREEPTHRRALQRDARRSASTSRRRSATRRPTSASACSSASPSSQNDAAEGREARGRARLGRARRRIGQRRPDSLFEGALLTVLVVFIFLKSWRSTVITGLALPVSVHRVVHRRARVRLHAQRDVAARPVARDRHPRRRRDRRAREHRAPHGDGQGPRPRRRAKAPPRSASRSPRRRSRSSSCSCRSRSWAASPQQWFAPFALTIACSVLVSLFVSFSLDPMLSAVWHDPRRPIGESARGSRASSTSSTARSTRLTARYKRVIGWALAPPLPDGRARARRVLRRARAAGDRARRQRRSSRSRIAREFQITLETPPGSNLDYTQTQGLAAVDARAQARRRSCTRTRRSAARRGASTRRRSTCGSRRRRARARPPGRRRAGAAQRDPPARAA